MRNFVLFFVLFAFALPVGSAWGQSAVLVLSPSIKKQLAYDELKSSCSNAVIAARKIYRLKKLGASAEETFESIKGNWRGEFTEEDASWINVITKLIYNKGMSVSAIKQDCLLGGETLHQETKRLISSLQ